MMFNKSKDAESELISSLKQKISELENQLNAVANDNGSIIVKQLPNGMIELNGVEVDNTTEVEYYNSSQATYGELTMFRIGKEAKQREMDKLTKMHMDEVDKLNNVIESLRNDIVTLNNKSTIDNDTISMYEQSEKNLKNTITENNETINRLISEHESEKQTIINRYDGMIAALEEDIKSWKERYLTINNITLDGTIITKYGKLINKKEN